jgi:hypothetical protein
MNVGNDGATNAVTVLNNGRVGFGGVAVPSQSIDVVGSIKLEDTTSSTSGILYKGASLFAHNFHHPTGGGAIPMGFNTFYGINAGNLTMGSTATLPFESSFNTGSGYGALTLNTLGYYNTADGVNALTANTTGYSNNAHGAGALGANTIGYNNTANGTSALAGNTTGYFLVGMGIHAGRYISGGVTLNQTSNTSVYLGSSTKALASGDTNEIVIGYDATGIGSNSAVIGNDSITKTILKGSIGIGTTAPNSSSIIDAASTTKGFLPPRMTTAEKTAISSPVAGLIVYDTTLNKLCIYTTAWETITSL